ncbi:SGNH/GDSL hydrolase family protein [Actinoplanes sp. HUAS TT8]|uniref:SGNH/GDSL hydrolase family protein n=1 Tax=Actinoplanes sp. HUAS TT8 TaxID=3447453 RepID=UPI003F51CDF9
MSARAVLFLAVVCLTGFVASAPPSPVRASAPLVVTLGDSVPAGTACGCTPFPDLYGRMLAPPARSVDLAVPGYTAVDVQNQVFDPGVRAYLDAASVVIVMAGANDMAEAFSDRADYAVAAANVRTTVADIVAVVRQGRRTPVRILILGYWNVVEDGAVGLADYGPDGVRSADSATRYGNAALRAAAAQSGATYVSTVPAFKGADRSRDPTALLAADGDHPNAAGHEAIAEAVYAAG